MTLFHNLEAIELSALKMNESKMVRVIQEEWKAWGRFGVEEIKDYETKNMAALCIGIESSSYKTDSVEITQLTLRLRHILYLIRTTQIKKWFMTGSNVDAHFIDCVSWKT